MPAPVISTFFKQSRSFSEVKQELLGSYFDYWCKRYQDKLKDELVDALLFIDLHAGEGHELEDKEGSPEFNRKHLYKSIINRPLVNKVMQPFYFEPSRPLLELVIESTEALPFYPDLINPPVALLHAESKALMAEFLESGCTAFLFADPFQSSFAQQLLQQSVSGWQTDMFLLIRPESINKAFSSSKISKALSELFGEHLLKITSYCKKEKDKPKRQQFILDVLISILLEKGYYTLLYKANLPDVEYPDHYLLFSSKDSLAYQHFKETVLPYCIYQEDGIPVFMANEFQLSQFNLFEEKPVYTIPRLMDRIIRNAGVYKYKAIQKIYEMDNGNTNYTLTNYLTAVEQLSKAGKIELLNGQTMQTIKQPTLTSVVKFK